MYTRPLVYMWKATYKDGSTLSQFGPESGYKDRSFKEIEEDKLAKFGLYPIPNNLVRNIIKAGTEVRSIPILPVYEIKFNKDKRLIYYRNCYISQEEYHRCDSCRREFTYTSSMPSIESKYSSPICPHCKAHDDFYCKKCNESYLFEGTKNGLCPSCNGYLEQRKKTSRQYSRERRWNEYIIGQQWLVQGTNVKYILTIDEKGDCLIT